MIAKPDRKQKPLPCVVVAGDVCIDWLSVPVDSLVPGPETKPMNWQLRGGRHMYARRGGAWLTGDFVEAAVARAATVLKAQGQSNLSGVPPDKIIHSMLMLGRSDRERNREKVAHWAVTNFDGYAGPSHPTLPEIKSVYSDDRDAQIVLLDDAGNGFRDTSEAWPLALDKGCKPLVIYKVRRPLATGALWERLKAFHLDHTVVLLSAEELRGEGANISRGLSWEQTATDLVLSVAREPQFLGLRSCPFLVIPLALEGAVLISCKDGRVGSAHLWYAPNLVEGDLLRMGRGDMSGFGSAFAAAITGELVRSGLEGSTELAAITGGLQKGIELGLRAEHNLLEEAFGRCEEVETTAAPKKRSRRPPQYPTKRIFGEPLGEPPSIGHVELPKMPDPNSPSEVLEFKAWRILDSKRTHALADLSEEVVRRGVEKAFSEVPIGKFEKLVTLDRSEIESYRSIRNLVREFLAKPKPERPLCLAVFGPPGGGKSFGVTQVARSIDREGRIEKLSFNVSQWNDPAQLGQALHRVSDGALRGKVPLVFFDEFDSHLGTQSLGWLKYFLAPMQDGVFADGMFEYVIGKAIFVFAGGTAHTFAKFRANAEAQPEDMKVLKVPDFLSRLRGYVDIFGFDPPANTNLLRRALVLRNQISEKYKSLNDGSGQIRIDAGVLRALLHVSEFAHGARSLEAILDMSHLVNRPHFDPSCLPPRQQLDLHVKGAEFINLMQSQQTFGAKLDPIAREIHELYIKEELARRDDAGKPVYKIGDKPALYHWNDLSELYKNSNREQAANYPNLLRAAGCEFEEAKSTEAFEFSEQEIENLARMEHERWMQERRIKQPDHPDLLSWEKLTPEEKDKDIRAVKAIPRILEKVGLRLVRLS